MPQNDCAFMLSLTRDPDESIVQTTSDAIAGCSVFHDRGRKTFFESYFGQPQEPAVRRAAVLLFHRRRLDSRLPGDSAGEKS